MAYNLETEKFYQAKSTVVDSTPDGDTVKEGFVDRLTPALSGVYEDINLLKADGMIGVGVPATESGRGIARVATAAEVAAKKTSGSAPAFVTPENMTDGIKLNDTVTSTSKTEAATANAVKTAYDKAASAAPRPQSYGGVGQWVNVGSSTAYVTLPSGGTWAYHLSNVNASGGAYYANVSGVASGGSQINTLGAGQGLGLAWRIA